MPFKIKTVEFGGIVGPVKDYFKGNTSLEKVYIGSNVSAINYRAFDGCESLMEISSANPVPPTVQPNVLDGCTCNPAGLAFLLHFGDNGVYRKIFM